MRHGVFEQLSFRMSLGCEPVLGMMGFHCPKIASTFVKRMACQFFTYFISAFLLHILYIMYISIQSLSVATATHTHTININPHRSTIKLTPTPTSANVRSIGLFLFHCSPLSPRCYGCETWRIYLFQQKWCPTNHQHQPTWTNHMWGYHGIWSMGFNMI